MFQIRLKPGQSSGFEAQVLSVPPATIMPDGWVGIMVPVGTGLAAGPIYKRLEEAVAELVQNLRLKGQVVTDQYSVLINMTTGAFTASTTSTAGSDTQAGAAINPVFTPITGVPPNEVPASGGVGMSSVLYESALTQCLEVAREFMNSGAATGIVK